MRLTFELNKIDSAITLIREQHPIRKGKFGQVGNNVIEEVKAVLKVTEHKDIRKLALSFDIKRLLACVEIVALEGDESLLTKASNVLELRPRDSITRSVWFKLKTNYPCISLESLLKSLISANGPYALKKDPNISDDIILWMFSPTISKGLLKNYQSQKYKSGLDKNLLHNFIEEEDGLYQESWRVLLIDGSADAIQIESSTRILQEYDKITNVNHRNEFGQHYLNTICSCDAWKEPILEYILGKYGIPKEPAHKAQLETEFWKSVSKDAKREFRRWLILKEIESFFEGERAEFWREYYDEGKIIDVQKILNGDGFMLEFDGFGVIEFKYVGNAAYVYPSSVFKKFWTGARFKDYVGSFKDKDLTIKDSPYFGWDGRIIHHEGWQGKTKYRLSKLFKKK